jgi:endonuclease/exonuclease/phosphatase family metal-dependent hydrolase
MGSMMSSVEDINLDETTYRILSYNVEWGFLKVPDDINTDSCGHPIPHTDLAQQTHLTLISKNIGLLYPDICFLQEMGSLDAVNYIANKLKTLFNLDYSCYYSNGDSTGNQGVGLLIKSNIVDKCEVTNIPNFKLNRGLGVTLTETNNVYKLVGVHLKSLYDRKIQKDEEEQEEQIQSVIDWINGSENSIVCGDFNNVPGSAPINKIINAGYKGVLSSDKYLPNITGNTYTEFHGKSGKESGSRIDYIFTTPDISLVSSHIVDFTRECSTKSTTLRGETSDHLPVLGIFNFN